MPHLHLSLQAGDDLILKRMKRRHLRADAIAFCDAGAAAAAGRRVRRRHHRRLPDRDRGHVRPLARSRRRMRPHAPARVSVLAAARHAGGAHAAGARARSSRSARGGCARRARRRCARHLDGEIGARAARAGRVAATSAAPSISRRCGLPRRSSPGVIVDADRSPATTAGSCSRRDRRRARLRATGPCHDRHASRDHLVTSVEQLERSTASPTAPSIAKETDRITAHYRAFIEAAPFFALASGGPDGLDCSPRGDAPGFVRVHDEKTLLIPDRRGNNRIDTLAQHPARPARRAAVPHSRLRRDHPRQRPRRDLDRSGAARELRRRRQGAARGDRRHGRPRLLPVRQGDRALEAVGCRRATSSARACRAPARSSPISRSGKVGGEEHDRAAPERLKATLY